MMWPLQCLWMLCKKTQKQSRTRTCHNKTQYTLQTKPKLYINTPPPQHPFIPTTWPKQCQGAFPPGPVRCTKLSTQGSNHPLPCGHSCRRLLAPGDALLPDQFHEGRVTRLNWKHRPTGWTQRLGVLWINLPDKLTGSFPNLDPVLSQYLSPVNTVGSILCSEAPEALLRDIGEGHIIKVIQWANSLSWYKLFPSKLFGAICFWFTLHSRITFHTFKSLYDSH